MKLKTYILMTLVFVLTGYTGMWAQERTNAQNQDKELGKVSWYRDYDTALAVSKKSGKPVLILFQEVPGCATCRNYGHNVLSNPLMTEAIENEFVPLAIFNNKGGKDKKILDLYKEPTWNNPVVRIVNEEGDNLVKRIARDYSAKGLYTAMVTVLEECGKEIPEYMKLLGDELATTDGNTSKDTYYSMYCFWTGEKNLGSQEGVLNTEAGFMKGKEVVKVTYNPTLVSEDELSSFANKNSMRLITKDNSYRASSRDEDYYLQHTPYKYLPLTPLQRTKINSAIGKGQKADKYLSPQQKKWLTSKSLKTSKTLYNMDFQDAWNVLAEGS